MAAIVEEGAFPLVGKVQHYAWGGFDFIPALIGIEPEPEMPYAEYWLGAHDKAPSEIVQRDGTRIALNKVIKEQPEKTLGAAIMRKYGRLPFLFKVLDVNEMLSIQVHPSKAEAEAGFARENALGIPLDAAERNYKDDNHKPELQLALTDFWLLHGFKPENELRAVLEQVLEFTPLRPIFAARGYYGLYEHVMTLPREQVNALLEPLARRILPLYEAGTLEKSSPDYWAAKAMAQEQSGNYDRGIFSIYFFNLVHLEPGQGIFQDAGVPHAALEGQALEIMANSDNVIRGGLTPKHVDVPELLKQVTFQGMEPRIVTGKADTHPGEACYATPSPDFALSRILLRRGEQYQNITYSTEILLCLDGEARLDAAGKEMHMQKGGSVVVFAGESYRLLAISDQAVVCRAYIPRA
ncbi:MAG TPA: mannose-6-phosphate isomerase, class I [Ktedonobacteraceae bacterium]|nr:mannose-6-phosphate isomerase, class I [Ktedonobacteraceae bacterium]